MKSQFSRRFLGLLVLAGFIGLLAGCKTSESELSQRPWNAPKSWENGLPSSMMERR